MDAIAITKFWFNWHKNKEKIFHERNFVTEWLVLNVHSHKDVNVSLTKSTCFTYWLPTYRGKLKNEDCSRRVREFTYLHKRDTWGY